MTLELFLQRIIRDGAAALGVCVVKHGGGQLQQLVVAELHAVLLHARAHHVLQLAVLDQAVAWGWR